MSRHWLPPGLAAALATLALAAQADGITLEPRIVQLPAASESTDLWLENPGDTPWNASARLYAWSQPDDGEALTSAEAVAVSPQHFRIAPHGRQRLRLVRLGTAPERETSYRLVIEETARADAPPSAPPPLLRYSTAVFLAPAAPVAARVEVKLTGDAAHPALRVSNSGDRHARLSDLAYVDAGGQPQLLIQGLAGYVLAGASRTWPLPARPGGYQDGRFQARIGRRPAAALPARRAVARGGLPGL